MPNPERTYVDRLQRGRELHSAVNGFSPAFAPSDPNLLPAVFETFLDTLDEVNTHAETFAAQYGTNSAEYEQVKGIKV